MFALADEPEKAARWAIFLVGGLVAAGVQAGTLYSVSQLTPAVKKAPVLRPGPSAFPSSAGDDQLDSAIWPRRVITLSMIP